MSTIVTRYGKGSPLTWLEVDNNFTNLNTDKIQSGDTVAALTITSATINGGSINSTTIGASTASSGVFTSLSDSGNLTFTSTGNRILGDFSNATVASRVNFQTSTSNSGTYVSTLPSGTGNISGFFAYNAADGDNASLLGLYLTSTVAIINSSKNGTGTNLPMTFYTGGSERMRIDTSGNVGIGTTSPGGKLGIATGGSTDIVAALGGTFPAYTYRNGTGAWFHAGKHPSSDYFYIGNGATPTTNINMVVDTSGNVGIGTTSPGYRLDVQDASAATRVFIKNTNNAAGGSGIYMQVTNGASVVTDNTIRSDNSGNMSFFTGTTSGSERMRITSAGNVGIGTTSPANFSGTNLQVEASSTAYASTLWVSGTYTMEALVNQNAAAMSFGSRSNHHFALVTNDTERMRIDSSGNVGIGTTSPTSAANYKFVTLNGTSGSYFEASTNGVKSATIGSEGSDGFISAPIGNLRVYTNGSERMRIDSSGNVGIGGTSTGSKLYVAVANSATLQVALNLTNTSNADLQVGIKTNESWIGPSTATALIFMNNNSTERMRITSGGEVYIAGTTDQGAYNLQCNGTGVWGAGAYVNGSDERIKQDITPIDTGLDVVNKLNPVTYKYKEDWSKDQSIQTGFIAQDLLVALEGKNYVDGIVQQGGEYMSVAYQNIIPLLTKAIQELSAKVTSLEAQLQGK